MKAEVKGNVITLEGMADEVAQALKLLGYAGATLAPKYVPQAPFAAPYKFLCDLQSQGPVDAPKNTSYTYALPLEEWRLPDCNASSDHAPGGLRNQKLGG